MLFYFLFEKYVGRIFINIISDDWENNLQNGKGKFTYNSDNIIWRKLSKWIFFGFDKITYIHKNELETIFLNNNEYSENQKFWRKYFYRSSK